MKSPHLLSTVHDLAICTRSVQSSQKRRFRHYDSDCCFNNTWPSLVKLVEAVRTIPVDMQVPKFGRNRRRQMQQKTLYRSLVMKLEDVTQANEEIDEAVHRSASAYRGAGSRRFSYFKS